MLEEAPNETNMARKCSHGHNQRAWNSSMEEVVQGSKGSLRLFGVQLDLSNHNSTLNSSSSMNCLSSSLISSPPVSSSASPSSSFSSVLVSIEDKGSSGYLSDAVIGASQQRKKGVPWSEEEHKLFLVGLKRLGKGDWRGISRNFVTTRTPTQVASHAQKFFLRQSGLNPSKKRRYSLLDTVISSEAAVNINANSDFKDLYCSSHNSGINLDFQATTKKLGIDLNHSEIADF